MKKAAEENQVKDKKETEKTSEKAVEKTDSEEKSEKTGKILVTGGCCQGKLDWAAAQFALRAEEILDGASCSLEAATYADAEQSRHPADAESGSSAVAELGSPVAAESGTPIRALNHFHLLVRRWMDAGEDAAARTEDLLRVNPGMVILTDEIGSGIIPMDGAEKLLWQMA